MASNNSIDIRVIDSEFSNIYFYVSDLNTDPYRKKKQQSAKMGTEMRGKKNQNKTKRDFLRIFIIESTL